MRYSTEIGNNPALYFGQTGSDLRLERVIAPVPSLIEKVQDNRLLIEVNSPLVKAGQFAVFVAGTEIERLEMQHIAINIFGNVIPGVVMEVGRIWATDQERICDIVKLWNGFDLPGSTTITAMRYNFFPGKITIQGQTVDLDNYEGRHTGIYGPTR